VEEDFKVKVDKKRLKEYTSPEKCYFFFGLIACFCTGLAWPICGVLFALMLSAMSILDFEVSRTWTGENIYALIEPQVIHIYVFSQTYSLLFSRA
jgi:hypothetical protein